MGFVELLDIQGLTVTRMNLPFQTKILVCAPGEKIGHLVKPIVLVAVPLALASCDDEA